MLDPRWHKVIADLWSNKVRTALTMLTIAVGVFAVGFVSSLSIILTHDMDQDFQSSNAHGATIYCEPFDDSLLPALQNVPGLDKIEGRSSLSARIISGLDKETPVEILAIPPVDKMQIDRLKPGTPGGSMPPLADREIFIERSAMSALSVRPGDMITIELTDGHTRELRLAAFVHDANIAPFSFTGQVEGYVTPETLVWLGGQREYDRLFVTVTENRTDQAHVAAIAQAVAEKIGKGGRQVYQVYVYQPGRHFASDIFQGVILILSVLGALAVFLSGFLVVNTIMALLGQHIRQIGMMKAVGGETWQILAMYLALLLCFGLLALIVAMPLSAIAAYSGSIGLSQFINIDPGPFRIPIQSVILQAVIATVVPVGAALIPLLNAVRITVREAISSYGLGKGRFGAGWLDRLTERVRFLSRPLLISLRNTVRRKFRLGLTLSTLTLGGAIFIAVFNLWAALDKDMADVQGYFLADINVSFDRAYRFQKVAPIAMGVPGVAGIEGWGVSAGQFLSKDKTSAVDIVFFAPPPDSKLIKPVITSGRWLLPGDENAVVVGNHLLSERPDLAVGDDVVIKINDKESIWHIVGIYKLVGNVSPPLLYTSYDYLTRLRDEPGMVYELRIITAQHDYTTQQQVLKALVARFKEDGIQVTRTQTGEDWRLRTKSQTDLLVYFLLMMAVLIALVGSLGLMGTMSINVLERTREIGVMRAIGAPNGAIFQIVIVEGMLIGSISWMLAAFLSIPITYVLNSGVGAAVMTMPLDFHFGLNGLAAWLVSVLALSAISSALPAWNAMRLTVREVLAYE